MSKIDYSKFPKLKEQVDYLRDLQNLVILLKNKISIISKDQTTDEKTVNENAIALIKAKLEIEGTDRKIEQKKKTCEVMEGTLEECLSEMESNYDELLQKAKDSDEVTVKRIAERDLENEEDRVAQYLDLKEYFHNLDADKDQVEKGRIVPLNAGK